MIQDAWPLASLSLLLTWAEAHWSGHPSRFFRVAPATLEASRPGRPCGGAAGGGVPGSGGSQ